MAYAPGTTPKTRDDVDTQTVYRMGSPTLVPRLWFNRLEACAYLGVSPRTLLRLRKEGKLTGYSPEAGYGSDPAGGKLRYRRADLDALMELKPAPHPDAPPEIDQDPIPGLDEDLQAHGYVPGTADVLQRADYAPLPDDIRTELGTSVQLGGSPQRGKTGFQPAIGGIDNGPGELVDPREVGSLVPLDRAAEILSCTHKRWTAGNGEARCRDCGELLRTAPQFEQSAPARIKPLVRFGGAHFLLTDREMADYLQDEAEDATWD